MPSRKVSVEHDAVADQLVAFGVDDDDIALGATPRRCVRFQVDPVGGEVIAVAVMRTWPSAVTTSASLS